MSRPRVITRCVASWYAHPDECIVEVAHEGAHGSKGCLISIREHADGNLHIQVYQRDAGVCVDVSPIGE